MDAYRFNNLVYIPITKHASQTYVGLFRDVLGWTCVQTDTIDWQQDHVFAHLIHPYDRHLKGTVEALRHYQFEKLVDDEKFLLLLGTAVFDLHSYPLYQALGDQVNKIDWLLLDHPKFSGNYITCKFLQAQGIDIKESDIPMINTSSDYEIGLQNRVKQIRDKNDLTGTLTYFYEQDVLLYNQVNQRTVFAELNNWSWDRCSWLTNKVVPIGTTTAPVQQKTDNIKNWFQHTASWMKRDYNEYPLRFCLEIIGWIGSVGCALGMTIFLPNPPLLQLYIIWVISTAIYSWASWTRGSFGMLANYALLLCIDTVGLIKLTIEALK
jgi:hypothetical protein